MLLLNGAQRSVLYFVQLCFLSSVCRTTIRAWQHSSLILWYNNQPAKASRHSVRSLEVYFLHHLPSFSYCWLVMVYPLLSFGNNMSPQLRSGCIARNSQRSIMSSLQGPDDDHKVRMIILTFSSSSLWSPHWMSLVQRSFDTHTMFKLIPTIIMQQARTTFFNPVCAMPVFSCCGKQATTLPGHFFPHELWAFSLA